MADVYSLELILTGKKIQKSGFRSAIENIALEIDITGTAENIKEEDETGKYRYSVKVVGEGDEKQLQEFIKRINKINTFHQINKIDESIITSKKQILKRAYPEFVFKRDPATEIPERMDEAVYYVKDLYKEMHSLKDDSNNNFEGLQKETHNLREETNNNLENIYKETRNMKEETKENFEIMEGKYHTISENLNLFVDIVAEYAKIKEPGLADKVDDLKKKYNR